MIVDVFDNGETLMDQEYPVLRSEDGIGNVTYI